MIWIIALTIIGVIIFFFLRDRDRMLDSQVDNLGGMLNKYSLLIKWLTSNPNAKIVKVTRDHIQISCIMQTTATYFYITETFNGVVIDWKATLGSMGNHNLNWKFTVTTPQEKIIEMFSSKRKTSQFVV